MEIKLVLRRIVICVMMIFSFISLTYAENVFPPQLAITYLQAPSPLLAEGKSYLVYELYLTNFQTEPAVLKSLEITGVKSEEVKFNFSGQDFEALIHPIGNKKDKNLLILQPGITKMVFLWLPYQNVASIPGQLIHKITYDTKRDSKPLHYVVVAEPMTVKKVLPIIVGSPLSGGPWLAGNAPSNTSAHRIANMVIDGHDYFAQRYAIDFVKMGSNGKSFQGDESKNESYYAYGQDVLAVASGVVTEVKDGIPENTPQSKTMAVPLSLDTVGGNHVVIDLGKGKYAFYAHMQPGSLRVKVGDKVHRGQILGKLGNSGNSSEPHLHFHVVDRASFIAANGVPYVFDNFYLYPSKLISSDPYEIQVSDYSLKHQVNELVLENAVMKFPG